MEVASHIEALRAEGDRMAEAIGSAAPEAPVATCPGWVVRDLARHTGGVHRWATDIVATPRPGPSDAELDEIVGRWPDDGELEPWFREGLAGLVAALGAASPDLACWAFLPAPSPLAMWARRQAHETAVHRVDAERAAGRTTGELSPVAPALAADGVDELLSCFVPRRRTGLRADPPTSLLVRCTDEEAGWVLLIDGDGVTTSPVVDGDAACTVRGSAADLYLALWNRLGPEVLTVEGDPDVLGLFLDRVHVRWA
jgi:uncharacterized protein (TIGR03083 family)